jgi:hypothetical protein
MMKKNHLTLCSIAALTTLALFNTNASADTISDTPTTFSTVAAGGTGIDVPVASFNESLGTLESVTLTLDLSTSETPRSLPSKPVTSEPRLPGRPSW